MTHYGRIRQWLGRHWCRDLAELRRQVQVGANDKTCLASLQRQLEAVREVTRVLNEQIEMRDVTIRELTQHNIQALAEMAEAHKKLLAEDLGSDLARVITTVELVGCRLNAIADRMGLAAAKPESGKGVDP